MKICAVKCVKAPCTAGGRVRCSVERAVSFFTVENGVHTGRANELVTEFMRFLSVLQKVWVFIRRIPL